MFFFVVTLPLWRKNVCRQETVEGFVHYGYGLSCMLHSFRLRRQFGVSISCRFSHSTEDIVKFYVEGAAYEIVS